jgi:hypothetical protein
MLRKFMLAAKLSSGTFFKLSAEGSPNEFYLCLSYLRGANPRMALFAQYDLDEFGLSYAVYTMLFNRLLSNTIGSPTM